MSDWKKPHSPGEKELIREGNVVAHDGNIALDVGIYEGYGCRKDNDMAKNSELWLMCRLHLEHQIKFGLFGCIYLSWVGVVAGGCDGVQY